MFGDECKAKILKLLEDHTEPLVTESQLYAFEIKGQIFSDSRPVCLRSLDACGAP